MKKIMCMIAVIALIAGSVFAVDFNITQETKKIIEGFSRNIVLEPGEKLSDKSLIAAVASKTVPAGYRVTLRVRINVMKIETVE